MFSVSFISSPITESLPHRKPASTVTSRDSCGAQASDKRNLLYLKVGRDSSVGTATGYGRDGPGIESRWEARFSAPVQTCPGAHPASCTMGTGSFLGGKVRPGRGADHSLPSSSVVKKDLSYTSMHPMGRTACTEPQCLYSIAIPLLPLWAVRSVHSLSACTV